jgi:glycogen operon protein
MIQFRKTHPTLRRHDYFWGERNELGWAEINWHGIKAGQPDWNSQSHSIAFTLAGFEKDNDIHVMINAWISDLTFELPSLHKGKSWFRSIDTSLASPDDIAEEGKEIRIGAETYLVPSRSLAVLISKANA